MPERDLRGGCIGTSVLKTEDEEEHENAARTLEHVCSGCDGEGAHEQPGERERERVR